MRTSQRLIRIFLAMLIVIIAPAAGYAADNITEIAGGTFGKIEVISVETPKHRISAAETKIESGTLFVSSSGVRRANVRVVSLKRASKEMLQPGSSFRSEKKADTAQQLGASDTSSSSALSVLVPTQTATDALSGSASSGCMGAEVSEAFAAVVWFEDAWGESYSEDTLEFGGRLHVEDPYIEGLTVNFEASTRFADGSGTGYAGDLTVERKSGFSFYRKLYRATASSDYVIRLSVKVGEDESVLEITIRTMDPLPQRTSYLQAVRRPLIDRQNAVFSLVSAREGTADVQERSNMQELLVSQYEDEEKVLEVALKGNIRGALETSFVRDLIQTVRWGGRSFYRGMLYMETSDQLADAAYESDARKSKMASDEMVQKGLGKMGFAKGAPQAKLTRGQVLLTALKGLFLAIGEEQLQLFYLLWDGNDSLKAMVYRKVAAAEKELLESEEAAVALALDPLVIPLLDNELREQVKQMRFTVNVGRQVLAEYRMRLLAERMSRVHRLINDLRNTYLPEWQGASQKGKAELAR